MTYRERGTNRELGGTVKIAYPRELNYTHGWYKTYNEFSRDAKWRMVANAVGCDPGHVLAVVTDLLCCANKATPRGFVGEWDPEECAAILGRGWPVETVARIYVQLETIKWIVNDYIASWDKNQPQKRTDNTNAERQARHRVMKKQRRAELLGHPQRNGVTGVTPVISNALDRDKNLDCKLSSSAAAIERAGQESGQASKGLGNSRDTVENLTDQEEQTLATLWCHSNGVATLKRILLRHHKAVEVVTCWLQNLSGDAVALRAMFEGAEKHGVPFSNLIEFINAQVGEHKRTVEHGPPLPLRPVGLRSAS